MKFVDIEKVFTEEVASYIAKGYKFFTRTMSGSQGEVAKVDLINDKEVVRIWLDRKYHPNHLTDGIELLVLRTDDERYVNADQLAFHNTMWTSKMEIVKCKQYWQMQKGYTGIDFYLPDEEGEQAIKKHEARVIAKYSERRKQYDQSKFRIGLKLLRKIPGHKNKRLSDIEKFWMSTDNGKKRYYVKVKGNIVAVA